MDCPEKFLNIKDAEKLIDFSGGNEELNSLSKLQLEGAVALFNIIREYNVAYLADEVGMGKTYIALGVVALMRHFCPSLKVLYIVPRQNLLHKWYKTDYPNFLRNNYLFADYRVKTAEHRPVARAVECRNLRELIEYAATGYYGDYFIKMSSFSFALSDSPDILIRKLEELHKLVPAFHIPDDRDFSKHEVKEEYAKTINRILPDFDLVVIDEAHNFRKGPETSDRNKVLGLILGTYPKDVGIRRVRKALLLSATPFEYGLEELKNQLIMVGFGELIPDTGLHKHERDTVLNRFMIRRLNTLTIGDKNFTRNMYRNEKRAEAAISLGDKDYKIKLVTALVQKKVGELLCDMNGQYQPGMLASFESYIPSTKRFDVEFDGDDEDRNEAKDNSIIQALTSSYRKATGEHTLPHPKMEKLVEKYGKKAFYEGEKQLIFVRRIQSVYDLKKKFDDYYDDWLKDYLDKSIQNDEIRKNILEIFHQFKEQKAQSHIDESINPQNENDDGDLETIPSQNNFFTYFFRGKFEGETKGFIKPLTFRQYLTSSDNKEFSQLFQKNGRFYKELFDEFPADENFYCELLFSMLRLGHGFIDMYLSYLEGGKDGFLEVFISTLKSQREKKEKFSTYTQLCQLIQNLELVVKTNFAGYRDAKDFRRYIQQLISPLEPIVGAKGGDDKSVIARKFRLPGYPMILISTDVLQEGEDLHTFCRSVSHYGLSASPIAIEQKTGRVDRVGSLAHRLIYSYGHHDQIENLGIQVEFPFIKESIESIQVREIANRLNEFLKNMHDFDSKLEPVKISDSSLADRSPISPLIKAPLKSLFNIDDKRISSESKLDMDIEGVLKKIQEQKKHIEQLKNETIDSLVDYSMDPGPTPNSLLLKIRYESNKNYTNLKEFMQQEALPHFRRACLKQGNLDHFQVYYDVHLFIGDKRVTQPYELKEAIERLKGHQQKRNFECKQIDYKKYFMEDELKSLCRNHNISVELHNNQLIYHFTSGAKLEFSRKQKVKLECQDGYLIMTSKVFDLHKKSLTDEQLLEYTLERNSRIDIVEFLSDDDWLFARIVHPLKDLQPIEFMYYSYVLACEADHLEHIIQAEDCW